MPDSIFSVRICLGKLFFNCVLEERERERKKKNLRQYSEGIVTSSASPELRCFGEGHAEQT